MADLSLQRIPVVAGLAYIERVRQLPSSFTATLAPEPGNRYFRHAIVVFASGDKIGYLAPEIASRYYDSIATQAPLACPARRAAGTDHATSGVELLLDFSSLTLTAAG